VARLVARPTRGGAVSVFTIVVKYHHNGENGLKSLYTYTLGRLLYAPFIILVLNFNVDGPCQSLQTTAVKRFMNIVEVGTVVALL
jgi:hypothetical protein